MDDFLLRESLSPQAAEFLKACVTARVNLVISGGTSAGFELEEVFVFDVKGFQQDGALAAVPSGISPTRIRSIVRRC